MSNQALLNALVYKIAGKLLAEGLNPYDYTEEKAIEKIKNCVSPKVLEQVIKENSPLIIEEMKKMSN
jgi:hypothetical protein